MDVPKWRDVVRHDLGPQNMSTLDEPRFYAAAARVAKQAIEDRQRRRPHQGEKRQSRPYRVLLVSEPHHATPHERDVAVYITGAFVGYLSRASAHQLTPILEHAGTPILEARGRFVWFTQANGRWLAPREVTRVGVTLLEHAKQPRSLLRILRRVGAVLLVAAIALAIWWAHAHPAPTIRPSSQPCVVAGGGVTAGGKGRPSCPAVRSDVSMPDRTSIP